MKKHKTQPGRDNAEKMFHRLMQDRKRSLPKKVLFHPFGACVKDSSPLILCDLLLLRRDISRPGANKA